MGGSLPADEGGQMTLDFTGLQPVDLLNVPDAHVPLVLYGRG